MADNFRLEEFEVGKVIGTGAFAVVHEGRQIATGNRVALKIIQTSKLELNSRLWKQTQNEIRIMRLLASHSSHPNIVRLIQIFQDEHATVICLEYLAGGEVFEKITKRGHYTERNAASIVYQIADALNFIHSRGILHRDIKPENIMYEFREREESVKLVDFGLSVTLHACEDEKTRRNLVGSPAYVAPEVIRDCHYSASCDMWSLGIILYILLVGYPPFYAIEPPRLFNKPSGQHAQLFQLICACQLVFQPEHWSTISLEAKQVISGLITLDCSTRLQACQIMSHPWVLSMHNCCADCSCPLPKLPRMTTMARVVSTGEELARPAQPPERHLEGTIVRMKEFNAKRKFKAAAMACVSVIGLLKMRKPSRGRSFEEIIFQGVNVTNEETKMRRLIELYDLFLAEVRLKSTNQNEMSRKRPRIEQNDTLDEAKDEAKILLVQNASFTYKDESHDDGLDLDQFSSVIRKASSNVTANELQAIFASFDSDGNGFIDPKEFIAGLAGSTAKASSSEQLIRFIFSLFDSDRDSLVPTHLVPDIIRPFYKSDDDDNQEDLLSDELAIALNQFQSDHDQVSANQIIAALQSNPKLSRAFMQEDR